MGAMCATARYVVSTQLKPLVCEVGHQSARTCAYTTMPTNHRSEGRPSGREPVDLATWKKRPRVLFLGSGYAGHRTRFENLESHTRGVQSINATYRTITGWTEGGVFERIPVIGRSLAGRLRTVTQAAPFASFPRPDAICTSAGRELAPFLWSQVGPL